MYLIDCFSNPILKAPLIACLSMGGVAALIGVILFYQKQTLFGEALSHAAYPGVILGLLLSFFFSSQPENGYTWFCFFGALMTSFAGALLLQGLGQLRGMNMDVSLSFLISTSFGLALFLISLLQSQVPGIGQVAESFLIGQVATVSEEYAYASAFFALLVVGVIIIFYRAIRVSLFDREFAELHTMSTQPLKLLLLFLISLSVMIGMRVMGVVLLSSVCIFPAVSARYVTRSLHGQFIIAGCLGAFVSAAGVLFSDYFAIHLKTLLGSSLWLPTGPLIVILFQMVFLFIFLFSWSEGVVFRAVRKALFLFRCRSENALKGLWKEFERSRQEVVPYSIAFDHFPTSCLGRFFIVRLLLWKKYVRTNEEGFFLTPLGLSKGQKLVRLHRLWELYLVQFCGMAKERVHPHAEEMEHIITPEVERELDQVLRYPVKDPHEQPIPPPLREGI